MIRPRSVLPAVLAAFLLPVAAARSDEKADAEFSAMLKAAEAAPDKADYKKLRAAFTRTSLYKPYAVDPNEKKPVEAALEREDYPAALAALDRLIAKHPINIEYRMLASFLHNKAGDKAAEGRNVAISKGLLDAIIVGHDGRSFETAFHVLDVPEEYTVMKVLRVQPGGQSLREHEGHFFDVHKAKLPPNAAGGDADEPLIYFNIDAPRAELSKMILDIKDQAKDKKKD